MKATTIQEVQKKAAKAKKEEIEKKLSVEELIDIIGSKLQAMTEKEGSIDSYADLMQNLLGTTDFKASQATEAQRQQLEMLIDGLTELGY